MESLQTGVHNCFAQVSDGLTPNNSSLGTLKPHYHIALDNYLCCEVRKRGYCSVSCYHCTASSCLACYQAGGQTEKLASVSSSHCALRSWSLAQRQQVGHRSTTAPTGLPEELKHIFPPPQSMGSGIPVSLSAKKQSASHTILQTWSCPRGEKKPKKSRLVAIRSRNVVNPPPKKAVITIQLETPHSIITALCSAVFIYPSFQHTGGRAHFFCKSGECHLHIKSSSKSFYCITNVIIIWKTEVISLAWK